MKEVRSVVEMIERQGPTEQKQKVYMRMVLITFFIMES